MSEGELSLKNLKFAIKDKDGNDIELVEKGSSIIVNVKNREEYLNALAKYEIVIQN